MTEEDGEFQHGAFAIKTIGARPMKTPALQAKISPLFCVKRNKVRILIAEIRAISLISANFACISFAQYCS